MLSNYPLDGPLEISPIVRDDSPPPPRAPPAPGKFLNTRPHHLQFLNMFDWHHRHWMKLGIWKRTVLPVWQ